MLIDNFCLEYDHALKYKGELLDLHNCYDFCNIVYDIQSQKIHLEWESNGNSVMLTSIFKFKLVFEEVFFFKIREREAELPFSLDTTLNTIGFLYTEDPDMDQPAFEVDNSRAMHMLLVFESNMSLRLGAKSVKLINV